MPGETRPVECVVKSETEITYEQTGELTAGSRRLGYWSAVAGLQAVELIRLAESVGLTLSAAHGEAIERFVRLLLHWNQRINLTGARSRDEVVGEHLGDAFALARLAGDSANLVDVGSGGGLPAIPFGVLRPDVQLTLVEPRQKRVAFLRTAVRDLGLAARIEPVRLEALAGRSFAAAASRATFAPGEWIERARKLVDAEGRIIVFAARQSEVEAPVGFAVREALSYETAAGHPRWAASYVPRGT
jgi:16S rRNA (guanine527-N7)-methyltransferase